MCLIAPPVLLCSGRFVSSDPRLLVSFLSGPGSQLCALRLRESDVAAVLCLLRGVCLSRPSWFSAARGPLRPRCVLPPSRRLLPAPTVGAASPSFGVAGTRSVTVSCRCSACTFALERGLFSSFQLAHVGFVGLFWGFAPELYEFGC